MAIVITKRTVEYIPQWNGNRDSEKPVKVVLRKLSQQEAFAISPISTKLARFEKKDKDGNVIANEGKYATREDMIEFAEVLATTLKNNCLSIENAQNEDGSNIAPTDLLEDSSYLELVQEIFEQVIAISELSKADQSEIKKPQPSMQQVGQ